MTNCIFGCSLPLQASSPTARPPKARPSVPASSPHPSPQAPLTVRRKGRPGAGAVPNAPNGASLPGGRRQQRVSEAGGGRWGRGGRRRRWQPAGTHAAPRPTWPAALPSLAAAARCPLTSGGECGNAGAGRARARCGPLPPETQKQSPTLCMPPPALGDSRRPPCRTQSQPEARRASCSGKRGHPPLRPLRPFPPGVPLPRLP